MVRQVAQLVQELQVRQNQAHVADYRFENDPGNLIAFILEQLTQAQDVVEAGQQGVGRSAFGHAGAVGHAQGGGAGAGRHQKAIHMPVITAGKFDDQLPPREAPGQTNAAHGRLSSRADHAHHLDARKQLDDELGQLRFQLGRGAEGCPSRKGIADSLDHARIIVPQNERAPGTDEIEIAVAIDIEEIRSLSPSDE